MRVNGSEDVSSYITHVQIVFNQLKRKGEILTVARVMEKIFWSLTNDFENDVCAIDQSRNLEEITINNLEGSLEAREQYKRKKKQEVLEELTNKDDYQGRQANVCTTQPRKRTITKVVVTVTTKSWLWRRPRSWERWSLKSSNY